MNPAHERRSWQKNEKNIIFTNITNSSCKNGFLENNLNNSINQRKNISLRNSQLVLFFKEKILFVNLQIVYLRLTK